MIIIIFSVIIVLYKYRISLNLEPYYYLRVKFLIYFVIWMQYKIKYTFSGVGPNGGALKLCSKTDSMVMI